MLAAVLRLLARLPQRHMTQSIRKLVLRRGRTQASFNARLAEGRLTVYGWYYDILTGRIERYDAGLKRYVALVGLTDNKLVDKLDYTERPGGRGD